MITADLQKQANEMLSLFAQNRFKELNDVYGSKHKTSFSFRIFMILIKTERFFRSRINERR